MTSDLFLRNSTCWVKENIIINVKSKSFFCIQYAQLLTKANACAFVYVIVFSSMTYSSILVSSLQLILFVELHKPLGRQYYIASSFGEIKILTSLGSSNLNNDLLRALGVQ